MHDEAPHDVIRALREAGCVYAEDEARLLADAATSPEHLDELVARRQAGEPLEYIVGRAEFSGLRVAVRPGVFVPRRRSEFLAHCAVERARLAQQSAAANGRAARVLDICCGSGALGLVVAAQVPGVRLIASDSSPDAVACARENLREYDCEVLHGDLFAALDETSRGGLDLIVANAPYVPTDEIDTMPAEARLFEPRPTLDGGPDGLELQRRLFDGAREWLRAGGCMLVETSRRQMDATERLASQRGYRVRLRLHDDPEATVVIAAPE